jgi:hypothetical protein
MKSSGSQRSPKKRDSRYNKRLLKMEMFGSGAGIPKTYFTRK